MTQTATPIHVPFHRASLGEDEVDAVAAAIRSGWLTMGPRTFEFEKQFAKFIGASHAVAVSTGTAALHLSLEAAGIRAGDEVIVPANTFTATAEAVTYLGARPVLADIDPATMNLDPADVRRRISPRTRAVIPVHLGGLSCDMDAIHALAREHGLRVIEDAAHALPSSYHGARIGSLGEFTCFSFYATKTLTTGEGGMITTNDPAAAARMRMMRLHGIERDAWNRYREDGSWRYDVCEAGFKYNFTDLQSAIGLVQLAKCDALRDARCRIANQYNAAFGGDDALELPPERDGSESSWHLYILRLRLDCLVESRDSFIERLREKHIACSVHFIPLHLHSYYQRAYGYSPGDFPVAEREYARCLSLPIFPGMSDDEIAAVIAAVAETAEAARNRRARVALASVHV